jgi:hypothetical protein
MFFTDLGQIVERLEEGSAVSGDHNRTGFHH